jgi:sulfatase modifying factor 1
MPPTAGTFPSVIEWPAERAVLAALAAMGGAAVVGGLPVVEVARAAGCPAGMANVQGRFCVDRYEASVDVVNSRGVILRHHSSYLTPEPGLRIRAASRRGVKPQAYISQQQAAAACEAAGKRLCTDAEWVTACKGRQPTLYPYGEEHRIGRCNDRGRSPLRALHGKDDSLVTFGYEAMNDPRLNQMPHTLAPTGRFAGCRNSYGLYDMVGNLHEWTANPTGVFRGGYYLDTHLHGQGCEYQTSGHNTSYHDYSIGFRCCQGLVSGPAVTMPPATSQRAKPQQQLRAGEREHQVAAGETLSGIAQRYRVNVEAICEKNRIRRTRPLQVGQHLIIPRPDAGTASRPTAPGPRLAPGERVHVVEAGQTLGAIARRYRASVTALCERNQIDRRRPIRTGQKLIIPAAKRRRR